MYEKFIMVYLYSTVEDNFVPSNNLCSEKGLIYLIEG